MLTPSPDGVQSGQGTTNFFDVMGRIWKSTLPDQTSVTNEFYPTGLLKKRYGSREYPVEYSYDSQGRVQTMTTWQNFASGAGAATTSWRRDIYRGWLTNKLYAGNTPGPSYSYTPAGRVQSRTWARGTNTVYSYNWAGDLSALTYSDGSPGVAFDYDRRGRQTSVTQNGAVTIRTLDDAGNLVVEAYSGTSPLAGLSVTNGFDAFLRRTNLALVPSGAAPLVLTAYSYDPASRLSTVADGTNLAAYSYVENSVLVGQIAFTNNGALRMTTVKQHDYLNRLTSVESLSPQGSPLTSFRYGYNTANQRTTVTNADNSRWALQYDPLGQVTAGHKLWGDGAPVAGQQFEYRFDDIGNRLYAGTGGDDRGTSLRYANYTNNLLNQVTSRTVPGFVQMLGSANSNATVTLWANNGAWSPTGRKGEYFRGEIPVNNSTGAVWLSITNLAVLRNGTNADIIDSAVVKSFLPATPEQFSYDADGNLTSDVRWNYTWDSENRLTRVESPGALPAEARVRENWAHLPDGRWIERVVSTNSGANYYPAYTNRFVWDGQVLMAILDHTNGVVMSFVRGLDLSASFQGAGGAGGVLAVNFRTNGTQFVSYDGNGNVVALNSAADGGETARYEYGPFAEPVRLSGPLATLMPLRFSTQYCDDPIGTVKYLFRDYRPDTGRWLSRDPVEERGGTCLYGFVLNRPIEDQDMFGLVGLAEPLDWPLFPSSGAPLVAAASDVGFDGVIFLDLLARWRSGRSGTYELDEAAMRRMVERGQNSRDLDQLRDLLRLRCRRSGQGLMENLVFESFDSAGSYGEARYLGNHTRRLSGLGNCCARKAHLCLEVSDVFNFDERDPWPEGGFLDKIKYLGSIGTGAILNFPNPTWSYAVIPVHGKYCFDVAL